MLEGPSAIEETQTGAREGIVRLLDARLDAVFYVAGQPAPLLSGAYSGRNLVRARNRSR